MEKTQLHRKATLNYASQFMTFSLRKFCHTMKSRTDFNVLLHGFHSLIFRS